MAIDERLAAAEHSAEKSVPAGRRTASLSHLTEHLVAHVEAADKRRKTWLEANMPSSPEEREHLRSDAQFELQSLRRVNDPNGEQWVDSLTDKVRAQAGAEWDDELVALKFAEIVRRGLIELGSRKLDGYDLRFDRAFHDPLFDPGKAKAVEFGELAQTFVAETLKDHSVNGHRQKSSDRIKAAAAYICEVIGEHTALDAIDDDAVRRAREVIASTPSNRAKVYPGLPLAQQIERAARDGKPLLSANTQGFYLDTFRAIMKLAVRKRLISFNPAEDVRPIKREKVAPEERRLPWTPEQLKGFFSGAFYKSCAPGAAKPYQKADRPWRFWLPLLMLFSGARPGEILQLKVSDVRRTENGTWYLDLLNEDEAMSLKTDTSKRRIPIHPELIRMGFLQFLRERSATSESTASWLFDGIKPDKYGSRTDRPSKAFNRTFIPAEIELGQRQALYSLRHNVRDALRRLKAPPRPFDT
ncbi:site-specific integrase [Neotabrizicola shimadae]|uniref:Integrase n=1 Tax=Neotabrizicola shimadae TaxID=2807096 RepID=A0A8G1EAP7_9RHOB|nr:integrase [Neotabrizicola shimadae]